MIFLSILLLGFVAFPFALEHARFKMDETARADAPGDFCRLKNGLTHLWALSVSFFNFFLTN